MVNKASAFFTVDFFGDIKKDGSILIYTNDGGGGHKQAATAEEREFHLQQKNFKKNYDTAHPDKPLELKGKVNTIDVIRGSFPPLINRIMQYLMTRSWNKAKKAGDIEAQENLLNGKILGIVKPILADILLFIPVFVSTFFRLAFNRKITRIIDTQPIATSAIIKAARLVNFLFGRSVKVTKVMTDLPTEGAVHLSRPIQKLSAKDKAIFDLVATKPLKFDDSESEEAWWKRVFGLHYDLNDSEKSQVKYGEFPLRSAFLKWKDVPATEKQDYLNVKVNNDEEYQLINQMMDNSLDLKDVPFGSDPSKSKRVVSISMDPEKDVIGMITIGSQAAVKTKEYVKDFIDEAKKLPDDRQYILYAGCGRHTPGGKTLFKEVFQLAKAAKLPKNIKIIPLGFQDDDEFAPMMHHMTFGIAGAGGLTTMEMVRTAKGQIYLHSELETKKLKKAGDRNDKFTAIIKDAKQEQLLDGFAVWEKWNALYQVKEKQAEIVIPGPVFSKTLNRLLKGGKVQEKKTSAFTKPMVYGESLSFPKVVMQQHR